MKTCRKCGIEKSRDKFSPYKKAADGLHSYCKTCRSKMTAAYQKAHPEQYARYREAWRKRHPGRHDENRRKREYGLEPDQFRTMLEAQNGTCSICQEQMVRPHVDHNHATGEVRGLLCRACNFGLGFFRDSTERLQNAIKYLGEKNG